MELISYLMRWCPKKTCPPMFKDIWKCRKHPIVQGQLTNNMFKWKLGDSKSTFLWKDCWEGSTLKEIYPRLFNLAANKDISVAEMKNK